MIVSLAHALRQFGVESPRPRSDGRFSLAFNQDDRLDIHPLSPDTLLLEVELVALPPGPAHPAQLLRAAAFMQDWSRQHPDVVCLDAATRTLLLQRLVKDGVGGALWIGDEIQRFLNAVDSWRHALSANGPRAAAMGAASR